MRWVYFLSVGLTWLIGLPPSLLAIPTALSQIIQALEAPKEKKIKKEVKDNSNAKQPPAADEVAAADATLATPTDSADRVVAPTDTTDEAQEHAVEGVTPSKLKEARLRIDEAIRDSKLALHPATWYYRGVIYEKLLKDNIYLEEASDWLQEVLKAYEQVKKLAQPTTQFYSFAVENIVSLWSYYLDRGLRYYRQENFDQALACFTTCKNILPEEKAPLLYMAIVYQTMFKATEALNYYEDYLQHLHAVDLKNRDQAVEIAIISAMAAIYCYQLKQWDRAIAILDDALIRFPFSNELIEEKILMYTSANKIDDYAALVKETALPLPDKMRYYAYAYFLENQSRVEEAVVYYKRILDTTVNQYDTLRQLGLLFYNKAIKLYVDGQQLDAKSSWSYGRIMTDGHTFYPFRDFTQPLMKKMMKYDFLIALVFDAFFMSSPGGEDMGGRIEVSADVPVLLYSYLVQSRAIAYYGAQKIRIICSLEKCLKEAISFLSKAYNQCKQDGKVAKALYYSYIQLKKRGAAVKTLHTMKKQKHYVTPTDNPFLASKSS